jgi:hypothetical protein
MYHSFSRTNDQRKGDVPTRQEATVRNVWESCCMHIHSNPQNANLNKKLQYKDYSAENFHPYQEPDASYCTTVASLKLLGPF